MTDRFYNNYIWCCFLLKINVIWIKFMSQKEKMNFYSFSVKSRINHITKSIFFQRNWWLWKNFFGIPPSSHINKVFVFLFFLLLHIQFQSKNILYEINFNKNKLYYDIVEFLKILDWHVSSERYFSFSITTLFSKKDMQHQSTIYSM
jgi:hypothetical protein